MGAVFIIAGMLLLFTGVDYGILPMGRYVGAALPEKGSIVLSRRGRLRLRLCDDGR